jgi:hypothetical protein
MYSFSCSNDQDYYIHRQISQKLILNSSHCGDCTASIEVCFGYTMAKIIPIVARRLGILDTDISKVNIDDHELG